MRIGQSRKRCKKKNDKRFFTISPRFFHFLLAFKSRLDLNIQLVFNYFFIVQRSERVRAKWSSAGKQSEMYASSKYVESQRKESIVELLLLRGGVWAQHNRLPTTYRPTRDSRFKDLSFSLPLSFSPRRHCSRKRGSDLCALVKNKLMAYACGLLRLKYYSPL